MFYVLRENVAPFYTRLKKIKSGRIITLSLFSIFKVCLSELSPIEISLSSEKMKHKWRRLELLRAVKTFFLFFFFIGERERETRATPDFIHKVNCSV